MSLPRILYYSLIEFFLMSFLYEMIQSLSNKSFISY